MGLEDGMRLLIVSGLAVVALMCRAAAEEVGEFRNDWTGNSIVVEAVPDPKVPRRCRG